MKHKNFDPTKPLIVAQASSRNAMKHGCCSAETLVIPERENIQDFKTLETAWYKTYQPKFDTEIHMVDQLVAADWLLQRSVRTLAEIEKEIFEEQPNPRKWTEDDHKTISRFQRYRTANQNAFNKCRRTIEDHYKSRNAVCRQEEKLVLQKERHAIYKEKNKPEPSFEETIALMRKQAVALGFHPAEEPPTK